MMEEPDLYSRRKKQIQDLSNFIDSKSEMLASCLEKLGWTVESLLNKDQVQCEANPGHWVSKSTYEDHIEVCSQVQEGYTREELAKEPPSSLLYYEKSPSSIPVMIVKEQLNEIISQVEQPGSSYTKPERNVTELPKTMDRYIAEFSPKERLAIYDYVVAKGKEFNKTDVKVEDLIFDFEKKDDAEKPKSYLEMLAEQRDYKRRRQSYRAKNVHVTKKSYTEVMKEVIENQISYLEESRKEEEKAALEWTQKSESKDRNSSSVHGNFEYRRNSPSVHGNFDNREEQRRERTDHHRSKERYYSDNSYRQQFRDHSEDRTNRSYQTRDSDDDRSHRHHHRHHKRKHSRDSRSSSRTRHKKHKKHHS